MKGVVYTENRAGRSARRASSAGRSNGRASAAKLPRPTMHGRDNITDAELALDKDGHFLGLRVKTHRQYRRLSQLGFAICCRPSRNLGTLAGVYRTPAIHADVSAVFTNTDRDRALSRRRPARGESMSSSASSIARRASSASTASSCGAATSSRRARCRSKPALAFTYDCGEFAAMHGQGAARRRCRRLRGAARRGEEARQAARPRHRQRDRARRARPGCEAAEVRFDPRGTRDPAHGHRSRRARATRPIYKQILSRPARPRSRAIIRVAGRHRQGRLRAAAPAARARPRSAARP